MSNAAEYFMPGELVRTIHFDFREASDQVGGRWSVHHFRSKDQNCANIERITMRSSVGKQIFYKKQ